MNVPRPGGATCRAESEEEMTATNSTRTENTLKRLAAAALVALAAMLAVALLSPARAHAAGASDGNLVIDVPTTVPCALMADGTVVSPSEWKITTSGDAYIASASASGFPANVEWSAKTTDLAAAQAGSVRVSGTGNDVSVTGPSEPASARLAPSAGFEWAFSKLDAGKNADVVGKAAGGTAVLGSVTFTFAKTEPDAFAVYSADDGSLTFYKRANMPVAGQTFEGKTATEVYTGLETMTSIPGWTQNHFNDIKTVTVCDEGIAPTGTAFWFAGVRNLKTADVSKLDMSRCKTIECMFTDCISLETLDLSGWDTSSLTNMSQAFQHCASLTKLNVSGWDVSKVTNMQLAFTEDTALGSLDLSTWDNSATTSMKDAFLQMDSLNEISLGSKFKFVGTNGYLPTPSSAYIAGADGKWYDTDGNGYAPANIPSNKAMTYTAVAPKKAFAVYSADDQSLNFYKRASVPSAGEQFEGKTATEVFTGFETETYSSYRSVPWSDCRANVKRVTVVDEGLAPVSTSFWFYRFSNAESFDLSKLSTTNVTNMRRMFIGCESLTSLDLSTFDTSNAADMDSLFGNCSSLTSLDLSSFNTGRTANLNNIFRGCKSLRSLDLSSFDTESVTSMSNAFYGCSALQKVTFGENWKWVGTDGCLPTPSSTYITGADGKWYDTDGNGYAPADIPSNKAMTYTAVPPKTAFAVYSADDQSLNFYKRASVPSAGEQFEGKTATAVYTGIEETNFAIECVSGNRPGGWADSTSWASYKPSIKTASVVDEGITPKSTSCWFGAAPFTTAVLENCDLTKLNTASLTSTNSMFSYCYKLQKVTFGENWKFVGTNGYLPTPSSTHIAGADGKWYDSDGNGYAPADIPSNKAMTYTAVPPKTAFAVYSADDQSLNFYKRASVPSAGEQFEGKTATAVYTGIETDTYTGTWEPTIAYGDPRAYTDTSPWASYKSVIKTITAVDIIQPKSLSFWFSNPKSWSTASAVTSADLRNIDTSKITSMSHLFVGCSNLTTLKLSNWNVSNVTDMSNMFGLHYGTFRTQPGCASLTTLDLSSWNTSNVSNMNYMFDGCSKLSVDCSSWDVSKVTKHVSFNTSAPGVTAPLAWQASSDEDTVDSAIAPLCEERGSKDASDVASETAKAEAASKPDSEPLTDSETEDGNTVSTDVESATPKAVEGKPSLEEKGKKKSDMANAPCEVKDKRTVSENGRGSVEEKKR